MQSVRFHSFFLEFLYKRKPFFQIVAWLFLGLMVLCSTAMAQSKKELEKKKAQLQQDIENTNRLLKQTRQSKTSSISQLVTLNKKINFRNELIQTINGEIATVDHQIDLKRRYAELLVIAFKQQGNMSALSFIFAAEDVNQAYKRMRYLQQLGHYRTTQQELITSTQDSLNGKKHELQEVKSDKKSLLASKEEEKKKLDVEKRQQVTLLNDLTSKEKKLRAELKKKQQQEQQLSARIEDIIRQEIAAARRKTAASPVASTSKNIPKTTEKLNTPYVLSTTPETMRLSNDFESNKGKLPWPVEQGVISGSFGKHTHPLWHDVVTNNNGVNIATARGARARAIFDGKVIRVLMVVDKYAVLVQHGEYFTLYSNLENVSVKAGDRVSTKQLLGTITDNGQEGKGEVHLEIWKGSTKMNPEAWLASR
jgi:septal ring factor EnvC (AmiA/AmiB activator)